MFVLLDGITVYTVCCLFIFQVTAMAWSSRQDFNRPCFEDRNS